jgi:hypothetical protein
LTNLPIKRTLGADDRCPGRRSSGARVLAALYCPLELSNAMAFEDLKPMSKQFIEDLVSHVEAGTHTTDITRFSGDLEDRRARIVQKSAGTEPDYTLFMEGFSAGDAFQYLIVKGLVKGEWVSADTWSGKVDDSAIAAYQAG